MIGLVPNDGSQRTGGADGEGYAICPDTSRADIRGGAVSDCRMPGRIREIRPTHAEFLDRWRQSDIAIGQSWELGGGEIEGGEDLLMPVRPAGMQQSCSRCH